MAKRIVFSNLFYERSTTKRIRAKGIMDQALIALVLLPIRYIKQLNTETTVLNCELKFLLKIHLYSFANSESVCAILQIEPSKLIEKHRQRIPDDEIHVIRDN